MPPAVAVKLGCPTTNVAEGLLARVAAPTKPRTRLLLASATRRVPKAVTSIPYGWWIDELVGGDAITDTVKFV